MKSVSVDVVWLAIGVVLMLAVQGAYRRVKPAIAAWIAKRKAAMLTMEQRVRALEAAEAARIEAALGIAAAAPVAK